MSWLLLSVIGYFLLAIVVVCDKFILTKAISRPIVFACIASAATLPIVVVFPFGVAALRSPFDVAMALVAGIAFFGGLWTMFIAVSESEISHVGPLIGATTPLCVLLFGHFLVPEPLALSRYVAIAFLVTGSLIISFEQSKDHHGLHRGMLWGILAGALFALSHVASKFLYDHYDFLTGLAWSRLILGLAWMPWLALPTVRRALWHNIVAHAPAKSPANVSWRGVATVVGSRLLAVVGIVFTQYAAAIGNVSLVNALNGLEYAFVVVMVGLMSRFAPRVLSENYTRAEVMQEVVAVVLIIIGLGLMV